MRLERALALALSVALAAYFVHLYGRALSYPYVFDDLSNVIQNRAIRYLGHLRIFLESEHARPRPFTHLTFAASYAWSGLSLAGLRWPNFLLHAANAALVGGLFARWHAPRPGAWAGAAVAGGLFLLHPLAADTAIYLSGRSSLLALFFVLLALHFYARPPSTLTWLGYLVCAALGFLSRESTVVLVPLTLALHWRIGRRWSELVPFLLPLVAGGLVLLAMKFSYLRAASLGYYQIGGEVDVRSYGEYLALSLSLWPRILELFFRPGALALDHQLVLPAGWGSTAVLAGLAIWLVLPLSIWAFRRQPASLLAFCGIWLFASTWPTNSFFPVLDPLAERHLYLALPAIAWAAASAVCFLARRWRWGTAVGVVAAGLGLFALGQRATLPRVETWRSTRALWEDAYAKYPSKYRVVYNTWRSLLLEPGAERRAWAALYGHLRTLPPGALSFEEQELAVTAAATSLRQVAQLEEGDRDVKRAMSLELGTGFWDYMIGLRSRFHDADEASWRAEWESAFAACRSLPAATRARDPRWAESSLLLLLAEFHERHGRLREAIEVTEGVFARFTERHIPYWTKRERLGDLYVRTGRFDAAKAQYEAAAYQHKIFKQFPAPLLRKLHALYAREGDLLRASDSLGELLRVRTDDPEVRALYANLLAELGSAFAPQQSREAAFYARHGVSPTDLREAVRP